MTVSVEGMGDKVQLVFSSFGVRVRLDLEAGEASHLWGTLGPLVRSAEQAAREAYARYSAHAGGVSVGGDPLPAWDDVDDVIRGHWLAMFPDAQTCPGGC